MKLARRYTNDLGGLVRLDTVDQHVEMRSREWLANRPGGKLTAWGREAGKYVDRYLLSRECEREVTGA